MRVHKDNYGGDRLFKTDALVSIVETILSTHQRRRGHVVVAFLERRRRLVYNDAYHENRCVRSSAIPSTFVCEDYCSLII